MAGAPDPAWRLIDWLLSVGGVLMALLQGVFAWIFRVLWSRVDNLETSNHAGAQVATRIDEKMVGVAKQLERVLDQQKASEEKASHWRHNVLAPQLSGLSEQNIKVDTTLHSVVRRLDGLEERERERLEQAARSRD